MIDRFGRNGFLPLLGCCLMALVLSAFGMEENPTDQDLKVELEALSDLEKQGLTLIREARELEQNQDDESVAKARDARTRGKAVFMKVAAGYQELAIDKLADKTPVDPRVGPIFLKAGMCYMRAEEWDKANEAFDTIGRLAGVEDDLLAQALFWKGMALEKRGDPARLRDSFGVFKDITRQYPESKWAKYARGRLADAQYKDFNDN